MPTSLNSAGSPIVYQELSSLGQLLDELNCKSLFVVADPVAYELTGASRFVDGLRNSRQVTLFQDFQPNPTLEELEQGIAAYKSGQPDVTLAIGGGTSIDLAKVIGLCTAQPNLSPREMVIATPADARKGVPLIAVPTTAGTGSEATHFAVIYVDGKKHSVAHQSILPDFVFLDPQLTMTMPAHITADVGLDAFCQAIESSWSVHSTEQSLADAAEAIRLAWQNLEPAVTNPNEQNRLAMCQAAFLAGKAINISKTTAPHAISYTITSQLGAPHGRAVALTLGAILRFNSEVTDADCNDARGAAFVRQRINAIIGLLGFKTMPEAQQGLRDFVASLGCPTRLSEVGVETDQQIDEIATSVNLERLANNPRRLTSQSVRTLLESIR